NSKQIPNKFNFWLILVLFFALLGCDKMEKVSPLPTENAKKHTARVEEKPFLLRYENLHPQVKESFVYYDAENGFLYFSDYLIFDKIRAELMNKDSETLAKWESQFEGFVSLQSIYAQAMERQKLEIEKAKLALETKPLISSYSQEQFYADFVKQHKERFIFLEDGFFKMNIAFEEVGSLVSKDGLVKIGGDIFQFTKEAIKILKGGDVTKIDELKKANRDTGVITIKIILSKTNIFMSGRTESSSCQNSSITLPCCYVANSGYFNSCFEELSYQAPVYDYSIIVGTQCFLGICTPLYYISGYQDKTRLSGNCWAIARHIILGAVPFALDFTGITATYNLGAGNISFTDYLPNVASFSAVVYDDTVTNVTGFSRVYCRDAYSGDRDHYYYF
ncbi:hypothetical protein, partial [Thermoflexibacter ruber]